MAIRDKDDVWTDLETTGLDPKVHEIISIALLRDGYTPYYRKVRMAFPEKADPEALKINGYTEEAWKDALPIAEVLQEIKDLKLLKRVVLCGQNVGFDRSFLAEAIKKSEVRLRLGYHVYDTVTIAIMALGPFVDRVSLSYCAVALGIPLKGIHNALVDAKLAREVDIQCKQLYLDTHKEGFDLESLSFCIQERIQAWEEAGKPYVWNPSN